MSSDALTDHALDRALADRRGWRREDRALVRDLHLKDFDTALALVERIAREAVDHFRRPDMCISEFNRVRLTVANPHHGPLTEAELRLAAKVDDVIERHGPDESAPG